MKTLLITALTFSVVEGKIPEPPDSVRFLNEVTITANRIHIVPGSGEYIPSATLQKINQPDVTKALRIVPGLNIRDEEGFGLRPNIGMRGTSVNRSTKITLMEDGILIAPAPYADPAAYYFPTFSRMQGVEILKGSSQIVAGPYTIGGAINFLSTPIGDRFEAFSQLSYGMYGTGFQNLYVTDQHGSLSYVFELSRYASNGFKQLDNGGPTGFDRRDFMGKIRWTPSSLKINQHFTLKLLSTTEEADETYLGLNYTDFRANPYRRYSVTQLDRLDLRHRHISLSYTVKPLNNWQLNITAYNNFVFRDWARANSINGKSLTAIITNPTANQVEYSILTGTANGNVDYRSAARTYYSRGIQGNSRYSFNTGRIEHVFEAGVRIHSDMADRFGTRSQYTMTDGVLILSQQGVKGNTENQIRNADATSAWIQHTVQIDKLSIIPGLRYENIDLRFDNFGIEDPARIKTNFRTKSQNIQVITPGIGFTYQFTDYSNVFAGVYQGFSPPGMPRLDSDEQPKPEKAWNYELGYRYFTSNIQLQATGFYNDYSNILGSDMMAAGGMGTGDMFNGGKAVTQGVEFSVKSDLLYLVGIQKSWNLP
jgi:Fe(3+) dicitrate transport protein